MKRTTDKPNEHAVLLRLPTKLHKELVKQAKTQHRSTVGHLRHLIEADLKDAA